MKRIRRVLIDGDKSGIKMANELRSDFYASATDKLIIVTDFSDMPEAEIEDLFPKGKLAKIVARFLPRPKDTDEEFDDVVTDKPICNQKAEAEQARAYEEAKFNQEFVAKAKEINWGEGKTVYDVISGIIRPSVSPEPIQEVNEPEQSTGSLIGAYMDQLGTKPV